MGDLLTARRQLTAHRSSQTSGAWWEQLRNYDPWVFFSSVRALSLHQSAQTFLHFQQTIEAAFFKRSSAEKCAAQSLRNIRPVYASDRPKKKKILSPWCHYIQVSATAEAVTHQWLTNSAVRKQDITQRGLKKIKQKHLACYTLCI